MISEKRNIDPPIRELKHDLPDAASGTWSSRVLRSTRLRETTLRVPHNEAQFPSDISSFLSSMIIIPSIHTYSYGSVNGRAEARTIIRGGEVDLEAREEKKGSSIMRSHNAPA